MTAPSIKLGNAPVEQNPFCFAGMMDDAFLILSLLTFSVLTNELPFRR